MASYGEVARVVSEGEKKERNMAGMGVTWPCPWPASLSPRVSVGWLG